MTRRIGGTKRSSWQTFRRRLLLVRLLLREPMAGHRLIELVCEEMGDDGYPDAAASALKHDLDALKDEFGCRIRFNRTTGTYVLEDLGELALLDLPDTTLEALAFLEASFPQGADLPEHTQVHNLLNRLLLLLPESRREQHRQARSTVRLQFPGRTDSRIDKGLVATIRRAVKQRRELTFTYQGSDADGQPRHHRVAPYNVFFRPEGHGYLDATVLEVTPPGNTPIHAAIDYRLDRIMVGSVQILPQVLPKERISPPSYALRYRLVPAVARRRDVATFFPESKVTYHDDGSATVTATATNLWQARQILLRYGHGCIVEAPPELVAKFRETMRGLVAIYEGDEAK